MDQIHIWQAHKNPSLFAHIDLYPGCLMHTPTKILDCFTLYRMSNFATALFRHSHSHAELKIEFPKMSLAMTLKIYFKLLWEISMTNNSMVNMFKRQAYKLFTITQRINNPIHIFI